MEDGAPFIGTDSAFLWLTAESRRRPARAPFNPPLTIAPAKFAGSPRRRLASASVTAREPPMPISEIPIFAMLRSKMQWHQERQRLLAENVANADTPKFKPRDLAPPKFDSTAPGTQGTLALAVTSPGHIAGIGSAGSGQFAADRKGAFEV